MTSGKQQNCLITVATEAFVPGARVMLASFVRHNPWFDGEMLVVHDGLSDDAKKALEGAGRGVCFHAVSNELKARIAAVAEARPKMADTAARFYSLEALRPFGHDRVLFCDADILFISSVEDVFRDDVPLQAVGDGCYLRGHRRMRDSFAETGQDADALDKTFNAGFMMFGPEALTGADYEGILAKCAPERFQASQAGLHDQLLFNLQFEARAHLVGWQNNFLLKHRRLILKREKIGIDTIRVLHFNLHPKPWLGGGAGAGETDPLLGWAWRQWQESVARQREGSS